MCRGKFHRYACLIFFLSALTTPSIGQPDENNQTRAGGNSKFLYGARLGSNERTSIKFDGTYRVAEAGPWFDYQDFTVLLWLKPGAAQEEHANIVDTNHRFYTNWVFQQWRKPTQYIFGHGGAHGGADTTNLVTLAPDTWQHVAL